MSPIQHDWSAFRDEPEALLALAQTVDRQLFGSTERT
jgi:hypothetical protein